MINNHPTFMRQKRLYPALVGKNTVCNSGRKAISDSGKVLSLLHNVLFYDIQIPKKFVHMRLNGLVPATFGFLMLGAHPVPATAQYQPSCMFHLLSYMIGLACSKLTHVVVRNNIFHDCLFKIKILNAR